MILDSIYPSIEPKLIKIVRLPYSICEKLLEITMDYSQAQLALMRWIEESTKEPELEECYQQGMLFYHTTGLEKRINDNPKSDMISVLLTRRSESGSRNIEKVEVDNINV
ncbi:hypothetical protein K501DRAFT_280229 [Backusella circina FSU 941]|nr:hypothetical protein K501DRAFT_280229 [Backusella circina FSU 941]